jgi:hypothetical protein
MKLDSPPTLIPDHDQTAVHHRGSSIRLSSTIERRRHGFIAQVGCYYWIRFAISRNFALFHQQAPGTEVSDGCHVVADEENRNPAIPHLPQYVQAFFLKSGITDRQHFIDNQYVCVKVSGNGKRKSYIHAGRVSLDWRVDESFDLCESHDLVELPTSFVALHAKYRAIQVNIFPTAQFRMESGAHLQQAGNAPLDPDASSCRRSDPRKELE